MHVFVSWSGERSKVVASHLSKWLKMVIQSTEPWMSPNIDAGRRWSTEIADKLGDANFGVICLTPENLGAPWLFFEAGALAKKVEEGCVVPYLVGLDVKDIQGTPLGQFQAKAADEQGTRELVESVNKALPEKARLHSDTVRAMFDLAWPTLRTGLTSDEVQRAPVKKQRPAEEVLDELLAITQSVAGAVNTTNAQMANLLGRLGRPRGFVQNGAFLSQNLQGIETLSDDAAWEHATAEVLARKLNEVIDELRNQRAHRHDPNPNPNRNE